MKKCVLLNTVILLVGLLLSPVHAGGKLGDNESRSLLKQVTLQSILPTYSALDEHAQKLVTTTRTFCDEPDIEGLQRVRGAWSDTLSAWLQTSPTLFGPATEDSIDFAVYFHPVKKAVINGFLAKIKADPKLSVDQKMVNQSGVGGQGLATVEYLLFDRKQSDINILSTFTDSKIGQQRCDYLVAVEALLASNIHTIVQAWKPEQGNYAEAFYTAGDGSAYFTNAYEPMELLVNRLYQAIQAVEIKQLGVPLGLSGRKTGKRTYPYKLEAWRSGHSLQNVMSVLKGVEHLFVAGGLLASLEAGDNKALAHELKQQLNALLATQFKSNDWFKLLKDSPDEVIHFYKQVRAFSDALENGLAPALGVKLGFNQNDGD